MLHIAVKVLIEIAENLLAKQVFESQKQFPGKAKE